MSVLHITAVLPAFSISEDSNVISVLLQRKKGRCDLRYCPFLFPQSDPAPTFIDFFANDFIMKMFMKLGSEWGYKMLMIWNLNHHIKYLYLHLYFTLHKKNRVALKFICQNIVLYSFHIMLNIFLKHFPSVHTSNLHLL